MSLGSIVEQLLEHLLVEHPPRILLARGVLALLLVLARVILAFHLGAVGNEVVGVSAGEVALLLTSTTPVLEVIMELLEPIEDQHELIFTGVDMA